MAGIAATLYLLKKLKLPPPFLTNIIFLPVICIAEYQASRANINKSKHGFSFYVPQLLLSFLYGCTTRRIFSVNAHTTFSNSSHRAQLSSHWTAEAGYAHASLQAQLLCALSHGSAQPPLKTTKRALCFMYDKSQSHLTQSYC